MAVPLAEARLPRGSTLMRTLTDFTVALALVLLVIGSPLRLRGQEISVLDAHVLTRDLTAWLEAVSRHRPGAADDAAQQAAGLSDGHLRDVLRELDATIRVLQRASARNRHIPVRGTAADGRLMPTRDTRELLGVSPEELAAGDLARVIERALLLHTDVAIHLYERHPTVLTGAAPPGGSGSVMVRDGQPVGTSVRWHHWHVARQLTNRLIQDDEDLQRVEQWYVAVAAYLYANLNLMDLVPHVREALRMLPDSSGVHFHSGLMHALMASPAVQHGAQQTALQPGQKLDVVAARTHHRQARTHLLRSLDADPSLVEAHVRLAQVLLAGRDAADARTHLHAALAAPLEPPIRYCAELFFGDALAALGHHDAAGEAYRRAAALFPDAPSPWFALSRLARAAGRSVEALELLDLVLVPRHDDDDADPWWQFHRRHADDPERLLDVWRTHLADGSGQP